MNWKEIEKKLPKAWEAFEKWLQTDVVFNMDEFQAIEKDIYKFSLNIRKLFDFFDKQGLVILIDYYQNYFYWFIKSPNDIINISGEAWKKIKTRTEAETAAFTRAFKMLERTLK